MTSILLVDDSRTDQTRIAGLLKKHSDYQIVLASNGVEALERLSTEKIDIVLTDLQMPEMDGLKLVNAVREQFAQVPVILMTGVGSEEIAVQAMREGASSYVNKKVGLSQLHETVSRVLAARVEQLADADLLQRLLEDEYYLSLVNDRVLMAATARFLRQAVQAVRLCPDSEIPRIGVAMEEALLNACLHGNLELDSRLREGDGQEFQQLAAVRAAKAPWKDRRVNVRASITPQRLEVEISDEGHGFDPAQLPDPTDPENLLKPHGRGVMMMQLFLDEVVWNDKGNCVTLIKNRQTE